MPGPGKYYQLGTGHETPKGGLTTRQDPDHTLVNYVKLEASQSVLETAVKLEAEVVVPKWAVKGVGWFAVLVAPQENRIGLWTAVPHSGHHPITRRLTRFSSQGLIHYQDIWWTIKFLEVEPVSRTDWTIPASL